MTFAQVLDGYGFRLRCTYQSPARSADNPAKDYMYGLADAPISATVSIFQDGQESMCMSHRIGESHIHCIGQWDSPEIAAGEIPSRIAEQLHSIFEIRP